MLFVLWLISSKTTHGALTTVVYSGCMEQDTDIKWLVWSLSWHNNVWISYSLFYIGRLCDLWRYTVAGRSTRLWCLINSTQHLCNCNAVLWGLSCLWFECYNVMFTVFSCCNVAMFHFVHERALVVHCSNTGALGSLQNVHKRENAQ